MHVLFCVSFSQAWDISKILAKRWPNIIFEFGGGHKACILAYAKYDDDRMNITNDQLDLIKEGASVLQLVYPN